MRCKYCYTSRLNVTRMYPWLHMGGAKRMKLCCSCCSSVCKILYYLQQFETTCNNGKCILKCQSWRMKLKDDKIHSTSTADHYPHLINGPVIIKRIWWEQKNITWDQQTKDDKGGIPIGHGGWCMSSIIHLHLHPAPESRKWPREWCRPLNNKWLVLTPLQLGHLLLFGSLCVEVTISFILYIKV